MFHAELHGKIPSELKKREDLLTSNVFGFLDYADRTIFLAPYLRECLGLSVTDEEAREAIFRFWPNYDDRTQPDVVIEVGGWYLLVEAKLDSWFGEDGPDGERNQLRRELREGRKDAQKLGLTFRLVTVTKEILKDEPRYPDLADDRDAWIWTNWQAVTDLLEHTHEDRHTRMSRGLLALLLARELRGFRGFGELNTMLPSQPYPTPCSLTPYWPGMSGTSEALSTSWASCTRSVQDSRYFTLPDLVFRPRQHIWTPLNSSSSTTEITNGRRIGRTHKGRLPIHPAPVQRDGHAHTRG